MCPMYFALDRRSSARRLEEQHCVQHTDATSQPPNAVTQIESAIHRRMRFDRHSVCEAELAGRERWQADRPDALVVRFRYREPLDCDQALGDVSERETRRMIGVWQISVKLVEGLL
jgi:hypothetical protein